MVRLLINYILYCATTLKKISRVVIKTESSFHYFFCLYLQDKPLKFAVYLLFSVIFLITSKYHISLFFMLKALSLFHKSKRLYFQDTSLQPSVVIIF